MESSNLKERILQYESKIFENYLNKRKQLIENIKNLQLIDLNKDQMNIFINDLKIIIDPLKNTTENIDHYLSNTSFKNNDSTERLSEMNFLLVLNHFFFPNFLRGTITSGSESELSDSSDSDISESELSE